MATLAVIVLNTDYLDEPKLFAQLLRRLINSPTKCRELPGGSFGLEMVDTVHSSAVVTYEIGRKGHKRVKSPNASDF